MLSKRLGRIIAISVIAAVSSTIVGFYLSYHFDLPTGPAIVLVLAIVFAAATGASQISRTGRAGTRVN